MNCRECSKDLQHESYIYLVGADQYFCLTCMPSVQPERLNPKEFKTQENIRYRKAIKKLAKIETVSICDELSDSLNLENK